MNTDAVTTKQILLATAGVSVGILALSAALTRVPPTVVPGRIRRLTEALLRNAGGHPGSAGSMHMPQVAPPELREVGACIGADNARQYSSKRLYMQLRVLDVDLAVVDIDQFLVDLRAALTSVPSVIYRDSSSTTGVAVLVWSEDPSLFAEQFNAALASLRSKFLEREGWTMFGKTYSNGHEKNLQDYLFDKPVRAATHADHEWAVWYPLRRRGPFYTQPPGEQCRMLLHHAAIGKAFSDQQAAHDIRLKCFGMDASDNEYVVGVIGDDLHALSRVVEEMRKTQHTAEYLEKLGPFFVGKRVWVSPAAARQ